MENTQAQLSKTNGFISAWQRWRERANGKPSLARLNCLPIGAERISVLSSPETFRTTLLAMIAQARQRILMTTLYLQDDEAGQEVLSALYAAKKAQPQLEVAVFVDWHRAQRGLIGKARSAGNAALYREMAQRLGPGVEIYGVPIQRRELLGVMHLKGFIIDDCVLYSGASLNNVYLQRNHRYRLDRYHLLQNRPLADSMAGLLTDVLRNGPSVLSEHRQSAKNRGNTEGHRQVSSELAKTHYRFGETPSNTEKSASHPLSASACVTTNSMRPSSS
ncbi:phospholipase D-like domain-containing protein [Propionivibrio sp.]|uniref:phospholipase D-like domain-containing protein n=1 Tax=Propionivibrio sp. TaxID=2212460 RepID=UPI0025CFCC88|nr:phospholipase D-like domain-containing protein [Propionivibrio sp.]